MKARINKTNYNRDTTVCAVIGGYNENGAYEEVTLENVKLKEFDRVISKNIYLDHDLSIQIAPRIQVRVFAKSMEAIEMYLEISNNPDQIKGLFDALSKHNKFDAADYIWTTVDLEEYRELKNNFPVRV